MQKLTSTSLIALIASLGLGACRSSEPAVTDTDPYGN